MVGTIEEAIAKAEQFGRFARRGLERLRGAHAVFGEQLELERVVAFAEIDKVSAWSTIPPGSA